MQICIEWTRKEEKKREKCFGGHQALVCFRLGGFCFGLIIFLVEGTGSSHQSNLLVIFIIRVISALIPTWSLLLNLYILERMSISCLLQLNKVYVVGD
jgi:hypothetical protein